MAQEAGRVRPAGGRGKGFFTLAAGRSLLSVCAMITLLALVPMMVAAAGWAFLYYLCGGGLGGAILLFIVLKMFGK